jgi:hypothetical protein
MHEGDPFSNGEELSAPEEVAQHWLGSGFVEQVISKGCVNQTSACSASIAAPGYFGPGSLSAMAAA